VAGNRKLVYGVGVNDWVGNIRVDGKLIREYQLWNGMLSSSKRDTPSMIYSQI